MINKDYKGFRDLTVYQKAFELAIKIFNFTKTFPKEETYSLIDQIRRSSRSVCANITESWPKRKYIKMFVSKLIDASGECSETEFWIDISKEIGYLTESEHLDLSSKCQEIAKMLSGMIKHPEKFCN